MEAPIAGISDVRYGQVDGMNRVPSARRGRAIVPRRPHGASGIRAEKIPLDRPGGLR